MSRKQYIYRTEGTSALKLPIENYDVYRRPDFLPHANSSSIISFSEAQKNSNVLKRGTVRTSDLADSQNRVSQFFSSIAQKAKHNKLLGDLFKMSRCKNSYRKEDVALFARGFSLIGAATFVLILFGV